MSRPDLMAEVLEAFQHTTSKRGTQSDTPHLPGPILQHGIDLTRLAQNTPATLSALLEAFYKVLRRRGLLAEAQRLLPLRLRPGNSAQTQRKTRA